MSGFTTWHSESATLPNWLQILHRDSEQQVCLFVARVDNTLQIVEKLRVQLTPHSQSNGNSQWKQTWFTRPCLCALTLLSIIGCLDSHPYFSFPWPQCSQPYKGLKSTTCQVPCSSGDLRVTQTSVFGQRKGIFTASCILFCSRTFGFSVFIFILFCFVFPRALLLNSSLLPLKKILRTVDILE